MAKERLTRCALFPTPTSSSYFLGVTKLVRGSCCFVFAVASAVLVLLFGTAGEAQTPPATSVPTTPAPAKNVAKKPATKAKSGAKQPAAVEAGPCKLGVISALGDRFSVYRFGLTIFETEDSEVPIESWGLDDLAVARVRAATGTDPSVRRINYPKGAFEPYYHPKSRFLPDPNEGLPAIVRNVTPNANCERYRRHNQVQRDGVGYEDGDQWHRCVQSRHWILGQTFTSICAMSRLRCSMVAPMSGSTRPSPISAAAFRGPSN